MICGKIIFKTQAEAIKAIEGFHADNRPTRVNRKPQNTYWCDACEGYHVYSRRKKHAPKKSFKKEFKTKETKNQPHKYNHNNLVIRNFTSKPI